MSARAKHTSWISAPSSSYDPYRGSYVGVSAQSTAELGKQGIVVTDEVVKDLQIPVMATALELMDQVFSIADTLGVGAEVRQGVYAIRGASYAGTTVSAAIGIPAGAGLNAAGGVLTGIGGAAALGAIAVVAVIGFALFGGSDDVDARKKAAQPALLHLRDRLTIGEFAAEQDKLASDHLAMALLPQFFGPAAEHKAAAAQAQKLAAFYRKVGASVSPTEAALFESLSNLARWYAAREQYRKMGNSKQNAVDELWGKSEPRTEYQLSHAMDQELPKLDKLVRTVQAGKGVGAPGAGSIALLIAAAVAGLYAAYNPAGAAALARSAGSKVKGAASAGVSKVRGILP